MAVMDEFKEEREKIKNAPFETKLQYFKDYYLMKTIIILLVLLVGGSYLFTVLTKKEEAVYVTLVNFSETQESHNGLIEPFINKYLNPRKQTVNLDSSSYISADENEANIIKYGYEDEQRLFAMVMTGDIDLFISGEDVMGRYALQQWFDDLRTVLSEEAFKQLEKEDRLLYWDGVPIGVRLEEPSLLFDYYYYNGRQGETIYAGFTTGSRHRETTVQFLNYLITGE